MHADRERVLSRGVKPATEQEVDRHNAYFNVPLSEFRRIRYINLVGEPEERRVHLAFVDSIVHNLHQLKITDIMVFNMLTGEAVGEEI